MQKLSFAALLVASAIFGTCSGAMADETVYTKTVEHSTVTAPVDTTLIAPAPLAEKTTIIEHPAVLESPTVVPAAPIVVQPTTIVEHRKHHFFQFGLMGLGVTLF